MKWMRYVVPGPPQWSERAAYIVAARYSDLQRRVRDEMDSCRPTPGTFSSGLGPCSDGWPATIDPDDERALSSWLGTLEGTRLLGTIRRYAERIVKESHCTEREAILYLVADTPLSLPYIVLEVQDNEPSISQSVTIHVADIDAQAEEVRAAWAEGIPFVMGVDAKRRRPGRAALPMIVYDAIAASRGMSWPKRYEFWAESANRLGLEEYGRGAWSDEPAEPWRAYRGRVERLKSNHAWLDQVWHQEYAKSQRAQEEEPQIAMVADAYRRGGLEEAARIADDLFGTRGGDTDDSQ